MLRTRALYQQVEQLLEGRTVEEGDELSAAQQLWTTAGQAENLKLPGAPTLEEPPAEQSSAPVFPSSSAEHMLGVSPSDFLAHQAARQRGLQSKAAQLLPAVEEGLKRRVQKLARILGAAQTSSQEDSDLAAAIAAHTSNTQDQVAQLRREQQSLRALLRAAHSRYHSLLLEIVEDLRQVVEHHILHVAADHSSARAAYLQSQCSTMFAKLQSMEADVLVATYKKDTVQALEKAYALLSAGVEEAQADRDRMASRLAAYRAGGQKLRDVATEYGGVKEALTQAETAVSRLQQILQAHST